MEKFVIYCKSFNRDINRYKKLVQSVKNFNKENLDFYTSVPQSDLNLFKTQIGTDYIKFVADEEIYSDVPMLLAFLHEHEFKQVYTKQTSKNCDGYFVRD